MKRFLAAVVFLFSCSVLFAQNAEVSEPNKIEAKNGIGGGVFGPINDNGVGGICYQRWLTDNFALEAGGMINMTTENYSYYSTPLWYDVWLEADFKIYEHYKNYNIASRLYLWVLAAHAGEWKSDFVPETGHYDLDDKWVKDTPSYYTDPYLHAMIGAGVGVGFDLLLFSHLSIPIKFGFVGGTYGISMTVGTGLKYIF